MINTMTTMHINATSTRWIVLLTLWMISCYTLADSFTITGIVRDAHTREPIAAARILSVNDHASATSNDKGEFSIQVGVKGAILRINAFEYGIRELSVRGNKQVIINLYPLSFSHRVLELHGLTGAVHALTQTGNIRSILPSHKSISSSPEEELQLLTGGEVRSISRSSATGIGNTTFIRGVNSLTANAQPLYVIDGVARNTLNNLSSIHHGFYGNPLSYIAMYDIESISLVKDGTSLWGSKAANGVVIINTKRATEMATKIDLRITGGITETPRTIPVMNAHQYKTYLTDLLGTAGLSNQEVEQLPYLNDDPRRSTYNTYHNQTNWQDEIYRTGYSQNYSIGVDGGGEKALYYFSLGYTTNESNIRNTNYQRYTMRLNSDLKLSEIVTAGINIGISSLNRDLRDDGINQETSPSWIAQIKSPFLNPNTFTFQGERTTEYSYYDLFNLSNPAALLSRSINTVKQNSFTFGLLPRVKINKELEVSSQFDYYLNKTNEDYYRPYLFSAPIEIQGVGLSYNTRSSQVYRNNTLFNNLQLRYNTALTSNQLLTVIAGNRFHYEYLESDYVEGHNSMSNSVINLRGSFRNLFTDGTNELTRSVSNYLTADYRLNNTYFVNLTAALDASSRFGSEVEGALNMLGTTWAFFPSVSGAWLLSSEEFMKNYTSVNHLRLRAGIDITGNDDIAAYQSKAYFTAIRFKGIANGMVLHNLANPAIRWETTMRAYAGTDIGLLNDRIRLNLDVYKSSTRDLLVEKNVPEVAGLAWYLTNEGTLSNTGFEAGMDVRLLNLKKIQWELNISAGHYKNRIGSLPGGEFTTTVPGGEILTREGQSAGVFYGYKTLGVYAGEAEATQANLKLINSQGNYIPFAAGDIHFEDSSGPDGTPDGIIDRYDRQIIGDPNPDFYGSVHTGLTVGRLSFSALFTGSYGNDLFNYPRMLLESGNNFSNQTPMMITRWKAEGQQTQQPRAVFNDPMGNARFSDRWIEDGSYLRLKNITMAFQVPLKNSGFITGLNIWASASNLITWTNYLGADPELSAGNSVLMQGIDLGLVPQSRSYHLGLKINL
jgi:TonB-linked SusC/RagA family outer membrane protein